MRKPARYLVLAAFVLVSKGTGLAQEAPTPIGGQFRVNVYTSSAQVFADAAMDANGAFAVVWQSAGQDGGASGIFARRFDSAGAPQGLEFQVNTFTSGDQFFPAIDMSAAGAFVIAWESTDQDGAGSGIFARRFNAAGTAQATELQINTYTSMDQSRPSVGIDDEGDFVVAWHSYRDGSESGAFARRFNSAGAAVGGEFQANTITSAKQLAPKVDLDADGDFVIVWTSGHEPTYGIFGKRYSSAGAPQGPEFQVHTYVTGVQADADVGLDADGDFVAVWRTDAPQDGSELGVFAQRFNSAGTPIAAEFQINAYATDSQDYARVAVDDTGDFVVAWRSNLQDGSAGGVFARRFRASGATEGPDLQVNTESAGEQYIPAVAADADGDFVVAWWGPDLVNSDVFAQRFDAPILFDVDGNGAFNPLTDGLLVMRFGFGFTGATLITGAVGAGCTRCDAPSITAYLRSFL